MKLLVIIIVVVSVYAIKTAKNKQNRAQAAHAIQLEKDLKQIEKERKQAEKDRRDKLKQEIETANANSTIEHYKTVLERLYIDKEDIEREIEFTSGKDARRLNRELFQITEKIFRIETKLEKAGFIAGA